MVESSSCSRQEDLEHILQLLSLFYPLSEELRQEFHQQAFCKVLPAGEHLLYQGDYCKAMYFIREGAMMAYTLHAQKKIVTYISVENEFISSLSGLYGDQPSQEAIVAIAPTVLWGVHTDILLDWYERFFELNYIIRKVYENYYRDSQERTHILRIGNAEERYRYFLKAKPGAAQRLPAEHVAAFLDMKPETLKRIQKQGLTASDEEPLAQLMKSIDKLLLRWRFSDELLNANVLAEMLDVPPYKVLKAIKVSYGLNFSGYLNTHRLAFFKEMIMEKDILGHFTIESIARRAGFASRSVFYRVFKEMEGVSPKEYAASVTSQTLS